LKRYIVKSVSRLASLRLSRLSGSIGFGWMRWASRWLAQGKGLCAVFALGSLAALRVFACGPFFPNMLLNQGDAAVLTAPEARFKMELERMKLAASPLRAQPATNYAQQTFDAELSDLRAALDRNKVPEKQRHGIIEHHRVEREKIVIFSRPERDDSDDGRTRSWLREGFVLRPDPTNSTRISGPMPLNLTLYPCKVAASRHQFSSSERVHSKRWSRWRNWPSFIPTKCTLNSRFGVVMMSRRGRIESNKTRRSKSSRSLTVRCRASERGRAQP
jgi:hypothetical protein